MSIEASPARVRGDDAVRAAVEIRVRGRWDALALAEQLVPFHSFLVQRTPDRWDVHARTPGCHGEALSDALQAIEDWRADRDVDASVQVETRAA